MFSIINQRKIWFTLSSIMVVGSILSLIFFGLNLGIDFTGGSLLEIEFLNERPSVSLVNDAVAKLDIGNVVVQPIGENGMILRFKDVDEETHQLILETINNELTLDEVIIEEIIDESIEGAEASIETTEGEPSDESEEAESEEEEIIENTAVPEAITWVIEEKRFDSIGPVIGQELKKKTVWAILIVLLAIISYIAWAFRKVSKPVASWKYGIIAVIALAHDIAITVGLFAIFGHLYGTELSAAFVAALLTILGYSVNDTIVIFDRIRENLIRRIGENFDEIIQESINEVIIRSINTAFTTLLALFALLVLGGATLREFVLALIIGIAVGTYSSIFLASPLLVLSEKFRSNK